MTNINSNLGYRYTVFPVIVAAVLDFFFEKKVPKNHKKRFLNKGIYLKTAVLMTFF